MNVWLLRLGLPIIIVGIVILISGIIFHLQGQAIVGPESSFMYANPQWITYGQQIAIAGMTILGIGIIIFILKKG